MSRWIRSSRTLPIGPWLCLLAIALLGSGTLQAGSSELRVGLAEIDISPPADYPMMGCHLAPRKGTGTKDPLKAKAIYLHDGSIETAIVFCDLGGIAIDLTTEVRLKASAATGLKKDNILLVATQCRNAPDYSNELWHELASDSNLTHIDGKPPAYVLGLIEKISAVIAEAKKKAAPSQVRAGRALQKKPVSFSRRIVLRDGSVRSGGTLKDPLAVKVAGPIDPEIAMIAVKPLSGDGPLGVLSNFSLHANTQEGMEFSPDFPGQMSQMLRKSLGEQTISLFGVGCCGDLNYLDPEGALENSTSSIGTSLASTIGDGLGSLTELKDQRIRVRSHVVNMPIYEVNPVEALKAGQQLWSVRLGEKLEFLDHLAAYRLVMLDQFHFDHPYVESHKHLKCGLSRTWKGVGDTFPIKIHLVTIGSEVAMIFLPGEIFVELGLSIKRGSPFPTTMVVQMAHACETSTVPTRAAYAQGGIEVLGALLKPGAGERLVEATLGMIREVAKEVLAAEKAAP